MRKSLKTNKKKGNTLSCRAEAGETGACERQTQEASVSEVGANHVSQGLCRTAQVHASLREQTC
jgi:hypothetical protein